MKKGVSPVVAAVVIVVALVLVIGWGWKSLGPQHELTKEPIDMGKMMSKDKIAPPAKASNPMSPGAPGAPR
jgi:hypothetical protein